MGTMSLTDEICHFDLTRSTKCASKQRRDQINMEIGVLRDLLPLPESARVRLSQLQIMSLCCVYIRKCALLRKIFGDVTYNLSSPFDFFQALSGFMLVTTQEGKLVYISENVTEHLGHSMVDMKMQGDSIYDIIDKRDHVTVQSHLTEQVDNINDHEISFFCRMNMSRCLKRQTSPADIKIMHVKGRFKPLPSTEPNHQQHLFMAICSPLLTPDIKESMLQNNTMVFRSTHSLDMSYKSISPIGEYHLGLNDKLLTGQSWYNLIHPEDLQEARDKHVQLVTSQSEHGYLLTVRMISSLMKTIWVNIVMSVQQPQGHSSREASIVCVTQVISTEEANQFKMHSHVYNLYQSRGIDMLCNSHLSPSLASPTNILDSFMDRVSEQAAQSTNNAVFMTHLIPDVQPSVNKDMCDIATARKIEHAHTVRALKRKLGENASSTSCKPGKISHFDLRNADADGSFPCGVSTLKYDGRFEETRSVVSPLSPVYAFNTALMSPVHHSGSYSGVSISEAGLPITVVATDVVQPISVDVTKTHVSNQEQVVPDWYLTPEASPTNFQNISDADVQAFARSLDAKLQMEIKNEIKQEKPSCSAARKPRDLPVIDPFDIDEFFTKVAFLKKSEDSQTFQPCFEQSYSYISEFLEDPFTSMRQDYAKPSCVLQSPPNSPQDVITEEEAEATLSLLNLPQPLLVSCRNKVQFTGIQDRMLSLTHLNVH